MGMGLIRRVCGLFGTLLFIMNGLLWGGRPNDNPLEQILLGVSTNNNGWHYALGTVGGTELRYFPQLTQEYTLLGWVGNWLYFAYRPFASWNRPRYDLYRYSLLSKRLEKVASAYTEASINDTPTEFIWSDDEEWIVFPQVGMNGSVRLVSYLVSEMRLIKVMWGQVEYIRFGLGFHVSPDSEWVYFMGGNGLALHFYRARLDGSGVQDLTPDTTCSLATAYAEPENDFFVFYCNPSTFPDDPATIISINSEGQLIQDLGIVPEYGVQIVDYLPKRQIVLINYSVPQTFGAIRLADGRLLWSVEGVATQVWTPPDESVIVYRGTYGALERINWDGSSPMNLLLSYGFEFPTPTLSDNAIWYINDHNSKGPLEIWRLEFDGTRQRLASFAVGSPHEFHTIEDGEWVIFWAGDQRNGPLTPYRMRANGSDLQPLFEPPLVNAGVAAYRTRHTFHWRPLASLPMSGLLFSIAFLRFPKKWRMMKP
ncbi:MAG: hypothetical protein BroJett018_50500 [Chloroflexota bacterium]|nr:MAG: hypothetical protein BroJett018_50500 [Chloroflexota bacterium]